MACSSIVILFFVARSYTTKTVSRATENKHAVIPSEIKPFVILIVPGHDTDTECNTDKTCNKGAIYNTIYERDLTVEVADTIFSLLQNDPRYKIIVARSKESWDPIFSTYFSQNTSSILDFIKQHKTDNRLLVQSGQEKILHNAINHVNADQATAIKLYGINKWADENNVDLVIHLHFNNNSRKKLTTPGPYKGFDIFIPEAQRVNAPPSKTIATDIYTQLEKKFIPEQHTKPLGSLYEDQSLIALGAANTLTKPAILIEYGYIYEKILQTAEGRKNATEQMAEQTVAGIQEYVTSITTKH